MGERSPLMGQPAPGARLARSAKFVLVAAGDCRGVRGDSALAQTVRSGSSTSRSGLSRDTTCSTPGIVRLHRRGGWRCNSEGTVGEEKILDLRGTVAQSEYQDAGVVPRDSVCLGRSS